MSKVFRGVCAVTARLIAAADKAGLVKIFSRSFRVAAIASVLALISVYIWLTAIAGRGVRGTQFFSIEDVGAAGLTTFDRQALARVVISPPCS